MKDKQYKDDRGPDWDGLPMFGGGGGEPPDPPEPPAEIPDGFSGSTRGHGWSYSIANKNLDLKNGDICGCCGKNAYLHRGTLNSSLVRAMIALYQLSRGKPWVFQYRCSPKVKDLIKANCLGDGRYWGVVTDGGKRNAYYALTQKGVDFIQGKIKLPYNILTYNNYLVAFDEKKMWSVSDAIKEHFDLDNLFYYPEGTGLTEEELNNGKGVK